MEVFEDPFAMSFMFVAEVGVKPFHDEVGEEEADERGGDHGKDHFFDEPLPDDDLRALMGPGCAEKAANERVGGAAGDAEIPGDQVPGNGADDRAEDDELGGVFDFNKAGRDGLGNAADLGRANEVENACHDDGREGGEHAGCDDG